MLKKESAAENPAGTGTGLPPTADYKTASLTGAALLVALVVALSFWAFKQIEISTDARKLTYDVISRAHALLAELNDAETGQRGYSLSGNETSLQPYLAARDKVDGHLDELRRLTLIGAAQQQLDVLTPLVVGKMEQMTRIVDLRRHLKMTAVLTAESNGEGKRLMDSIRAETGRYIEIEEEALAGYDAKLKSDMRRLFALIVTVSVLTFLFALSFAWLIYRESRHKLNELIHLETTHLLKKQEELNQELQRTNAIVEISEEKFAITLNSIGDAVIATDAGGRVTLQNPLAQKLTGWALADALTRPIEDIFNIISQQTRLPVVAPVRDTLANSTTRGLTNHTILIARDGSECDIAVSCAPIRTRAGHTVGAVLVFRDVTERTRLDQLIHAKNTELEDARAVADKANLAKSDFLSSMSHELRTPLSAILGFAQLIESGSPGPTAGQKRSIDQILKAGWYLLDLINEILDLALIESGKLSLSIEPLSLADVMHECATMIEPQAHKRGVSVTFPRFAAPCFVKADRTRVKQVLINLLSNAIKYNAEGGTVIVTCTTPMPHRVRVAVKDTGAGLPAEKLAQLFEPFNRMGKEEDTSEGTGIGLVVSKRLVELMDGVIGVASTVGKGSEFWIDLNVTTDTQAAAARHAMPARLPAQPDAPLRTVLYVEDNPANLMLVEDLIARRPDLRLLSARDGASGIEMALASMPDVILMDINLPGISGIEVLRILTEDPTVTHIPVIAVSANAMPRDIEKGLQAGFFRYLTKPIKVNEFMDTLDVALQFVKSRADRAILKDKTL